MLPCVIVVFMLLSGACGENPAVQVILANKGLQYGKHVGTGWVQEQFTKITFPDISGDFDIKIGKVHYVLSGVTIRKCDLPEPVVDFEQGTGLKTSITGLSIAVTGEWRTSFGVIHDGGTFDMAIFNMGVTSVVRLGSDAEGHLSVTSNRCDASVSDVDLVFHGGASWIFQPLVKYFKGHIIGIIQETICPEVNKAIAGLDYHLQAMNVSFGVNEVLTLSVPLTGPPVINASSLGLGFKGEFYSTKTHQEPPFVAQRFFLLQQPGYMMSMGVSEFTMNSASFGYFSAGVLQAIINDSMIPPFSPIHLNTSSMGMFIPQLPKMFPGLLMNLEVYAREAPVFSLQPGAGFLGVQVGVKAVALEPNGTQVPLFKLNLDAEIIFKLMIAKGKLMGTVMLDNMTLTLASSEIGVFKTDSLENAAKAVMNMGIRKVDAMLKEGIVIPRMKQAQLVNTVLAMQEGFVAIYSDAELLPTDKSPYL
ncbi:bactericidal permeability-increasing protein [Fundulus heteroclitus]|uniref:bactericidal permeability-increasing protein n=1 Tax=Fundulus heteroclitus TaxID=8078 RepID=UPI00165B2E63|nr:bactericidal permeability-increasing protein [Fundulus heteroclitus]